MAYETMSHPAVLVDDGVVATSCTLTPQQVLIQHCSGVYTTALITPERELVDWELHRKRLIRGIEILNTRDSKPFQALLSTLEAQGNPLSDYFDRHVVAAVKAALAAYYGAGADGEPKQEQPKEQQEQPQPQEQQHTLLLVCISPRGEAEAEGEVEGSTRGFVQEGRSPTATRVAVYCKAVQPPPYGPEHAVQAAVMGRPRSLPGAKASSWVAERRQYELGKPPEATEVLLSDADGRLLEGLTTNFFVITTTNNATTTTNFNNNTSSSSSSPSAAATSAATAVQPTDASAEAAGGLARPPAVVATLHACGPAAGSALPGVVQARLLEAAARLGMRVVLEPPRAEGRREWSEAFISNCIKRVQPLSRVFCPPGNAWGADPWDCQLPAPAGLHTTALRREMERIEVRTPWREL